MWDNLVLKEMRQLLTNDGKESTGDLTEKEEGEEKGVDWTTGYEEQGLGVGSRVGAQFYKRPSDGL